MSGSELKISSSNINITIIVITHEMAVVKQICSSLAVMEDGQIVEERPSKEFFANPDTERARRFLRAIGERVAD